MADFSTLPGEELDSALRRASAYLAGAGVPSPAADAELLAAFLLEQEGQEPVSRGRVQALALMGQAVPDGFAHLVTERGRRVPLQHLTGQAHFRGLTLAVGPGVFVPRPETELLVEHALGALARRARAGRLQAEPLLVDLCTGSGAIAAALASESPGARVLAVELSEEAAQWAERNLAPLGVTLVMGDARTALAGLEGTVDVVASNPPYIPPANLPPDPEVRDHDPELALYGGGEDGMELPAAIAQRAYQLLAPGGYLIMEHDESQGPAMASCLEGLGFEQIETLHDLAGRVRFTSSSKPQTHQ